MDPIQSLWIGDRLSRIEILSIRSFLAHGHPYHLYAYSTLEGVPNGVTVMDANAIVPEKFIFRTAGSLSIFSDWFRQELLFARGGYWADMDIVCLKPLDFAEPIVLGKVDCSRVSNALTRFPAGHQVTRQLADVSREPNTPMPYDSERDRRKKMIRKYLLGNRRNNVEWGEASGPSGFTRMVKHHGLWRLAKPYYYFHPVHFSFWACNFDNTFEEGMDFFRSSYCVHLWNEKIRRAGRSKEGPFNPGSLVQRMMERYGC
jgi:hypothetical protein